MKKKQATESVYLADHEAQTAIFNERTKELAAIVEDFKTVKGFYPYRPSQFEYENLLASQQTSADYFWNHAIVCSIVNQGRQADALADLWFRLYADTPHSNG